MEDIVQQAQKVKEANEALKNAKTAAEAQKALVDLEEDKLEALLDEVEKAQKALARVQGKLKGAK